jgi:acyl-CoA thioesterase I
MKRSFCLYGAAMLLFQGLSACDYAPPEKKSVVVRDTSPSGETTEPTRQIIAFGDSLYAGYHLNPKEGLAPQLQNALRENGYAVTVHNAGVSGDTTAAGLKRLPFVLDNVDQETEIVVLGLGGNDMLRGIKPAETRENLKAMLDELRQRKIEIVLTGMLASPNMGADYGREFNSIYPDLATQYGIPLMPFFLDDVVVNKSMMLDDGIHPNAKGVAKVVGNLTPFVEIALKKGE